MAKKSNAGQAELPLAGKAKARPRAVPLVEAHKAALRRMAKKGEPVRVSQLVTGARAGARGLALARELDGLGLAIVMPPKGKEATRAVLTVAGRKRAAELGPAPAPAKPKAAAATKSKRGPKAKASTTSSSRKAKTCAASPTPGKGEHLVCAHVRKNPTKKKR